MKAAVPPSLGFHLKPFLSQPPFFFLPSFLPSSSSCLWFGLLFPVTATAIAEPVFFSRGRTDTCIKMIAIFEIFFFLSSPPTISQLQNDSCKGRPAWQVLGTRYRPSHPLEVGPICSGIFDTYQTGQLSSIGSNFFFFFQFLFFMQSQWQPSIIGFSQIWLQTIQEAKCFLESCYFFQSTCGELSFFFFFFFALPYFSGETFESFP